MLCTNHDHKRSASMQNPMIAHFSLQGRVSTAAFRQNIIIVLAIGLGLAFAISFILFGTIHLPMQPFMWNPDPFHQMLFVLIPLFLSAPLIIKRLQDRGKKPHLFALFAGLLVGIQLFGGLNAIPAYYLRDLTLESYVAHYVIYTPIILLGLWIVVSCSFLDGTEGQNQYGKSPSKREPVIS